MERLQKDNLQLYEKVLVGMGGTKRETWVLDILDRSKVTDVLVNTCGGWKGGVWRVSTKRGETRGWIDARCRGGW